MNEIKDRLNEWRDIPSPYARRLNIAKISVIPNLKYRFNAMPVKSRQVILYILTKQFYSLC